MHFWRCPWASLLRRSATFSLRARRNTFFAYKNCSRVRSHGPRGFASTCPLPTRNPPRSSTEQRLGRQSIWQLNSYRLTLLKLVPRQSGSARPTEAKLLCWIVICKRTMVGSCASGLSDTTDRRGVRKSSRLPGDNPSCRRPPCNDQTEFFISCNERFYRIGHGDVRLKRKMSPKSTSLRLLLNIYLQPCRFLEHFA